MKPFLKWAGGKTDTIHLLSKYFPTQMDNYYEPFLGGGSVLLYLLSKCSSQEIDIRHFYVNDINETLIFLYICIQKNIEELLHHLSILQQEYYEENQQEYYYTKRNEYNQQKENSIYKSALFLFLNKTCFRGLYREGKNGFNVPFGHYKKVSIYHKDQMYTLHKLFNQYHVVFSSFDYRDFLSNVDGFVYLDPPYVPITSTSFSSYTKKEFSHKEFFAFLHTLDTPFVLSNSYSTLVLKECKNYKIKKIQSKRRIHSKCPQSKEYEVIVVKTP